MTRRWGTARGELSLEVPLLMGIVNVTPDSFSDGGLLPTAESAIAHGRRLVSDGAALLDIGGESTRPRAEPVALEVELERLRPTLALRFAPGRDALPAGDRAALDEVAAAMLRFPRLRLIISAPSPLPQGVPQNPPAKAASGAALDVQRADRVREFFAERGIDASRIEASTSPTAAPNTIALRLAPAGN